MTKKSFINCITLVAIFSIFSCSVINVEEQNSASKEDLNVVDVGKLLKSRDVENVGDGEKKSAPQIDESSIIEGNVFGPVPVNANGRVITNGQGEKSNLIAALILGPGINRAIAHVSFLKKIKTSGIPIHIVSGSGMGAVIAALYASGMTPEKIEWVFYKFFKKAAGLRPYSLPWLKVVQSSLLSYVKNFTIQTLKLSFVLPLYNKKEKKIQYFSRGDLYSRLSENLTLYHIHEKSNYSTSIQWEVYNGKEFQKYGANTVIGVDVLGKIPLFTQSDSFLVGVFGKIIGKLKGEKVLVNYFCQLPADEMPLDSQENLPMIMQKTFEESDKFLNDLIKKVSEEHK